jgi:hypothetical protein
MKRYFRYSSAAGVFLALLLLTGCSKLREEIEQHPSDIGKYCKILSLSENVVDQGLTHFNFSYNSAGDPLELVQLDNLAAGYIGADLHFRYDRKGRLSDVLQTNPGQTMVFLWGRYTYPSPRVVIDSVFEYQGHLGDANPPYLPSAYMIEVLKLDGAGRLINGYTYSSDPSIAPNSYDVSYDGNGDAVAPGVVYDNMVNIYQTSPVWQLVYRDYSRHNQILPPPGTIGGPPRSPADYDVYGLPTKFLGPSALLFQLYFFTECDVTYSCDVSASPTLK